jgi:ribonuclease HI
MVVEYYTDGAATMRLKNGCYIRENGGWAFALIKDDKVIYEESGSKGGTTNQEMELMAIDKCLVHYLYKTTDDSRTEQIIKIYSDSAYCINIFTNWIFNWKKNNWTRKGNKPIENLELIKDIDSAIEDAKKKNIKVEFIKVNGHSGNKWNEYVDKLAVKAKESCK